MIKPASLWTTTVSSLALTLCLASANLGRADEAQDLDAQVAKVDKTAKDNGVAPADLEAVSQATDVPVEDLKRQQAKTQAGPGTLFIANSIAAKTGRSFEEVMAAKASGKGWGQIAKENNMKLGPLLKEAKQVGRNQGDNVAAGKKSPKNTDRGQASADKPKKSPKETPSAQSPRPDAGATNGGGKKKK